MRYVPKTRKWIEKLKSRGINIYGYNDLPEDLKSLSDHRRAIIEGYVEKIGRKGRYGHTGIWRIKSKNDGG